MNQEERKYGHKKLVVWQNIDELNKIVFNEVIPIIPRMKFKLKDQIERSVSSVGANFIEGYYSNSTRTFIQFLGYSRRSLAEAEFWIDNCHLRRFIPEPLFASAKDLTIRTGYLIDRLSRALKKKTTYI